MRKADPSEKERAEALFRLAERTQMRGTLGEAIRLYRLSIAACPTPEAHTFLGWAMSTLGLLDEAILECRRAIELDPDYGNPYNDIGAYLINIGRWEDAIPWLEKAILAPRYAARAFPHMNLGRVYNHLGRSWDALASYRRALEADPDYAAARQAYRRALGKLN